jgi:hypothetical protein
MEERLAVRGVVQPPAPAGPVMPWGVGKGAGHHACGSATLIVLLAGKPSPTTITVAIHFHLGKILSQRGGVAKGEEVVRYV